MVSIRSNDLSRVWCAPPPSVGREAAPPSSTRPDEHGTDAPHSLPSQKLGAARLILARETDAPLPSQARATAARSGGVAPHEAADWLSLRPSVAPRGGAKIGVLSAYHQRRDITHICSTRQDTL